MTSSDPPEGPEHRTDTLSPVSPKPLHYPSPANIPILENQMDPAFNDTSTQALESSRASNSPKPQAQPHAEASNAEPVADAVASAAQVSDASAQDDGQQLPLVNGIQDGGRTGNEDMSSASADYAIDSSNAVPQSALEPGTTPAQPNAVPSSSTLNISAGADFATSLGAVDLQALLQSLSASAPKSLSADIVNASQAGASPGGDALASVHPIPPSSHAPLLPQSADIVANDGSAVNDFNATSSPSNPLPALGHDEPTQLPTAGAPGTSTASASALPPPPLASFQQGPDVGAVGSPSAAQGSNDVEEQHVVDAKDGENVPWGPETQKKYDNFLDEERQYVLDGNWDRFPDGSRMFIGNLSSEKVTKRDLFHVFHSYGKLAQISIKQAYGFVQFLEAGDCDRALKREQGVSVRGRKVHLEISRPQGKKNAGNEGRASRNRRSRSPERNGRATGERYRERGGNSRRQDNYRPGRSPSPRRRGSEHRRGRRSPDHYDGRRRSRSPAGRDGGRAQGGAGLADDDLPVPTRLPHQVPELQIIMKDQADRNRPFLEHVKGAFLRRGIKVDEMLLTARFNEAAVMRRQIIEGVLAVIRIDLEAQHRQKFHLSVFDRSAGFSNVRFEEYRDMDLNICVELVNRAKQNAPPGPANDYALVQYGIPLAKPGHSATPSQSATPGAMGAMPGGPNVSNVIANMDHATLQRLLDGMQNKTPGIGQAAQGGYGSGQAVAGMGFGQAPTPAPLQGMGYGNAAFGRPPMSPFGGQFGTAANNGPHNGAAASASQAGQAGQTQASAAASGADIQSIIAQLGQYQR